SSTQYKDNQFTRTLLTLNLKFMIFNLPKALVYIVRDAYMFSGKVDDYFDVDLALIELFWFIAFNIATFYYIIYFFLNIYFNKLFHTELCLILRIYTDANNLTQSKWFCTSSTRINQH